MSNTVSGGKIYLPSLAVSPVPSKSKLALTSDDFVHSSPVFRRGLYDCFGVDDSLESVSPLFSRSNLRTPPNIRNNIRGMKELMDRNWPIKALNKTNLERNQKASVLREEVDKILHKSDAPYEIKKVLSKEKKDGEDEDDDFSLSDETSSLASSIAQDESKRFFFSENDKAVKINAHELRRNRIQQRKLKQKEERARKKKALESLHKALDDDTYFHGESEELQGQHTKYFGYEAKADFAQVFRNARNELAVFGSADELPDEIRTARHLFLREQTKRNLLPLPLVLRKDAFPNGVFLRNKGLGDERIMPLISILNELPAVQSIDVCDNRLTDVSLMPLANKLTELPSVTHLDLSFNKIDDSSAVFLEYLVGERCQLKVFLMNGADVDDGECASIMQAINQNTSKRAISLRMHSFGDLIVCAWVCILNFWTSITAVVW